MAAASSPEVALEPTPSDGISSLVFSPSSNLLLCSSWDKGVRLYDASQNVLRSQFKHQAAVLDCCFSDGDRAFSGGLECAVKM